MNTDDFESLSPEEQEKIFHQTSFKEKGDLLMHSHEPKQLVRSLSQEELYLTAKEMDIQERSEILRYATLPQLFFISDVDCWKSDRIDPSGFVKWLETLRTSSSQSLLLWLIEMDYVTVVAALKKVIAVIKPEYEYASDELLGDTSNFTLDNAYYICVAEDNLQTIQQAFEVLYENHRGKYTAILEGVLSDLDDECEEEAYHRREMRLEERGFPPPERAHRIYRPLAEGEFAEYIKKEQVKDTADSILAGGLSKMPNYPVIRAEEKLFLDEVLLLFRSEAPHIADGIQEELAWLSNKVIACKGIDFSDEDRVRDGIARARWFVNIGLELLTGRDVQKAANLMKSTWLEAIFRTTSTRLLLMRREAENVIKEHWKKSNINFIQFMNPPYEYIFQGLMQKVPECYDPNSKKSINHLRDFQTAADVVRIESFVKQIQLIHEILIKNFEWEKALKKNKESFTLYACFATLFARFTLNEKASYKQLTEIEIRTFMEEAFEARDKGRVLKNEKRDAFIRKYFTDEQYALLRSLIGVMFDEINDEFSHIHSQTAIDLNLIRLLFWTDPKRKEAIS